MRVGHGYDLHRLVEGRKLILGGVVVEFEKGLQGHSDADVLAHAVADAVLGAAGLGDIGRHFPDNDPLYAGADSMELLTTCVAMARDKGWRVGNVDATIVAQAPRLAPYLPSMRENLASTLGVEVDAVNIKATTEEGLGVTGSGEAIAAHAVVLLNRGE
ncbi:MAG: 2-C-methyl-D-erythritol 2,4-cyclodiphosphate synthase [Alphaproteobacteria bacterium]